MAGSGIAVGCIGGGGIAGGTNVLSRLQTPLLGLPRRFKSKWCSGEV